uniref:Auxin-responsive protein n=1 Tax=Anthurium amnicola TaxID=1678845 RepID=A0A1D1ZI18_9ARAE
MAAKGGYDGDLDNLRATELRLGLPGTGDETQKPAAACRGSKRALAGASEEQNSPSGDRAEAAAGSADNGRQAAPAAKAQVVGWPPIRSYRKNCLQERKTEAEAPGLYVKVSMDGAPYLRKIDLNSYKGYKELREAMEAMFKCFSTTEGHVSSEYVTTYQDKDGDWMLAGDVPWEMFTSSCRRLRIMRGSEARGLGSNA